MTENDIKALDLRDTAFIEQVPNGEWRYWNPSHFDGARFRKESYAAAKKEVLRERPHLVVEKKGEDYKLMLSNLNKNYLHGIQRAVIFADICFVDFSSDPYSEKIYNAARRIAARVTGDLEEFFGLEGLPEKLSEIPALLKKHCPGIRINSPDTFTRKELKSLSPGYAVISKNSKGTPGYQGEITVPPRSIAAPRLTADTVDALIEKLADAGAPLIAEQVKPGEYKLVYSDVQKNFLQGMLAVGIIFEQVDYEDPVSEQQLEAMVNEKLRQLICTTQQALEIPTLNPAQRIIKFDAFAIPWKPTAINSGPARER